MIVVRTVAEARAALDALPRPLGFTPTMGALHAGHLGLVEAARSRCASVAASIFVNPAQFGRGEDFRRYPRDEARDLRLLEEAGVALVFAPAAAEMYPDGFATAVHVGGPLTESLEGVSRPGHFDGVTVIVIKLLGVARPDVLFLGEKGQAKSRLMRLVSSFLDDAIPYLDDPAIPLHDDPYQPITKRGRTLVNTCLADDVKVAWWGRDDRYAERLSPGTKFADIIGEIDPAKLAA